MPSELDRRRASEFKRRAKEVGQSALATIIGVSVRTLQRYIKLERAMDAQDVDSFEARFGTIDLHPVETQAQPQNGKAKAPDDAILESVLARHETELSYAQVRHVRKLHGSGITLSEAQWEHIVSAILSGRQPSP